jgi:putative ATP-binding cassette transporter
VFDTLALADAQYRFAKPQDERDAPAQGSGGFALGPVSLKIERGETLFIVGENGCGKTTLIKLLLGLYRPDAGQLLLNGEPVRAEHLDDFRQLFSAVFSDYYLFDS